MAVHLVFRVSPRVAPSASYREKVPLVAPLVAPLVRKRCHTRRAVKQWVEEAPGGWKARVRFDDGRGRSKTFPTQREARAWLRRTVTEINDGRFIPDAHGRLRLVDWVAQWEPTTLDLAPTTRNRRTSDLRNWILPEFGARPLGAITQPDVKTWIASMVRRGANAGSIKLRYETLSRLMQAAVDADLIKRSPCYRVPLPRYEREEMRLLTLGEIVALSEAIHRRYRALVLLAGTGGLRIGELGALRRSRVDLARGTVSVVENLILDNGTPMIGPLKTKASKRQIPLPRQTVDALREHMAEHDVARDGFVFTSAAGHVLRPYQFRRRYFHPATEKIGLAPLRPHDLRHSAISLWIASGANPKVVQVKAGHSSIKVTYDRYGHLFPDYDSKATQHLENLWEGIKGDNVVALPNRRQ